MQTAVRSDSQVPSEASAATNIAELRVRLGDASQRGMLVTMDACRRLLDGSLDVEQAKEISAFTKALHRSCSVAIDAIAALEAAGPSGTAL